MQKWENTGIWITPKVLNKNYSYLALPLFYESKGIQYLIITSRDEQGRSIPMQTKCENINHLNQIEFKDNPILELGGFGYFDEDGIMPCQVFKDGNRIFLLYIGWNRAVSVPFRNSIGLAELIEDKWKKVYEGPILDRNQIDTCFVASPFLTKTQEGVYRLYYLSCKKWINKNNNQIHSYNLTFAESNSISFFIPSGKTIIPFKNEFEYAISKPFIIESAKGYQMWYSYRASKNNPYYNIGYAESTNGEDWKRCDEMIEIERYGYDKDNNDICYPHVFCENDQLFMLYNGNNYGKTGFGVLKLKKKNL
jgi:hypothetical protein